MTFWVDTQGIIIFHQNGYTELSYDCYNINIPNGSYILLYDVLRLSSKDDFVTMLYFSYIFYHTNKIY